jgi:membrane protease subunit HflC
MKSLFGGVGLFILVILGAAIYSSIFIVDETVSRRLCCSSVKPVRVVQEPGLKFKLPFVQNVSYFDRRVLDLDSPVQEIIAADQERLVVDTFARYQHHRSAARSFRPLAASLVRNRVLPRS